MIIHFFFDDDGRVYLIYSAGKLRLVELNADVSGVKPGTEEQVVIEDFRCTGRYQHHASG